MSALARARPKPWDQAPGEALETRKVTRYKRFLLRFGGPREKGAMSFVGCIGGSKQDTIKGSPVEVDLRKETGN